MFIAQIYNFTVGAIINRPKKVCAIYAGELTPTRKKPLIELFVMVFLPFRLLHGYSPHKIHLPRPGTAL